MKKNSGFTLLEILIVISLIVLLAIAALVLFDPIQQINRGRDTQRKRDLDTMRKVFEDFYNDKGCYPKPIEVCYPGTDNGDPVSNNPCYICGSENTPAEIQPYLDPLPCDPSQPTKKYAYQVNDLTCPSWFKIYTNFASVGDTDSINVGCGEGGCGVSPSFGYDWGVSSPNIGLSTTPNFYCYADSGRCNNCSGIPTNYQNCVNNPTCQIIYGTFSLCCQHVPKPIGCP